MSVPVTSEASTKVPTSFKEVQVPIAGMDCAECTLHVQHAIAALPGVQKVDVLLASEKAVITFDPAQVDIPMIRDAVERAGYSVPAAEPTVFAGTASRQEREDTTTLDFSRRVGIGLIALFVGVLFVVVAGEWLGLFDAITSKVPLALGAVVVFAAGAPMFRNVLLAARRGQIISHTLMSLGVLAALVVGEWVTALVIVLLMYVGDRIEKFTTNRARDALRDLTALAPQTARVEREGGEEVKPIGQVRVGDVVIVRPGEKIPVDGEVVAGRALVNQAALTGEPLPVEVVPGIKVFAATIAEGGSLRVRATAVGDDTTFGRIIHLVENAESNRAEVQRFADRFSGYYLPIVLGFALVTLIVTRNPMATAATLVVACSCSIALATPIAMLASIGAAARRGILLKGGKYLEALANADVLLVDKTGTLTLGAPRVTDVVPVDGAAADDLLASAAALERESEHPLARAVVAAADSRGLARLAVADFEALPGLGVRGTVNGKSLEVGSARMVGNNLHQANQLEAQGKTLLYVSGDGKPLGILAASDTLRQDVPAALHQLRALGIRHIELLTGDNERAASTLAQALGISFRAGLLPEDKIRIVREYQTQGKRVVMIGDGVNDAPALAQADVGIAMRGAGTDIAVEAAHITLMRDDWRLVPEVFRIARRTMGVVKLNLGFTAVYNVVGLTLAALGLLPPVLAAAAQSLPDLGILANSSRLLRQK